MTVLNLIAFCLIVCGLRLVFRQINDGARSAERTLNVARGNPPPGDEASAKWLMRESGEQVLIEHGA